MKWKRIYLRLQARPERPDGSRRRVACIGDSITFGAGVMETRQRDGWTAVWQRALGEDCQILNYGVCAATVQRQGDFPYRKVGFLSRLRSARPELIVLLLGTNDTKTCNWDRARFARDYEELVTELESLPWPHRTALMTPPRAFPEEDTGVIPFDVHNDAIRSGIRPMILSLGERRGLPVADLYALTEDHPEYFADGVHPNVLGNRVIGEAVFRLLPV